MIIATYGAESAAYRTAGVIDEAIHKSDEDLMKKCLNLLLNVH